MVRLACLFSLALTSTPALADASLEDMAVWGAMGVNSVANAPFDDATFFPQIQATGVVGPGVELVLINPWVTVDFSDDGSEVTFSANTNWGALPFNGIRVDLTEQDAPAFTGFTVVRNTYPGFATSRVSVSGSSIALNFQGLSGAGEVVLALRNDGVDRPGIDVSGSCPGPADLYFDRLTPGGTVALLKGSSMGSAMIPAGPCAGVASELNNLQLHALFTANAAGVVQLTPNLPAGACGRWIQVLDVVTCTLSRPEMLP